MLSLKGRVMNVFNVPSRTNARDGEIIPGYSKVQIMGEMPLPQGGVQMELMDLRTDRGTAFQAAVGSSVECLVRPYAFQGEGGGVIAGISMVKGVEIKLLDDKGNASGVLKDKKSA